MHKFHFSENLKPMGSGYGLTQGKENFVEVVSKLGSKNWNTITRKNQQRIVKKTLKVPIEAEVFGDDKSLFSFSSLSTYDYILDSKSEYKHPFDFDSNFKIFLTSSKEPRVEKTLIEKQGFWFGVQTKFKDSKINFLLGETVSKFVLGEEFEMKVNWGDIYFVKDKLFVSLPSKFNLENSPSLQAEILDYGLFFQSIVKNLGLVSHQWNPFVLK